MLTLFSFLLHGRTRKKLEASVVVENRSDPAPRNEGLEKENQHDNTLVLSKDCGNLSEKDQDEFCIVEKAQDKPDVSDETGVKCSDTDDVNNGHSTVKQTREEVLETKAIDDNGGGRSDSDIFRKILLDLVPTLPSEYFDLDENGDLPESEGFEKKKEIEDFDVQLRDASIDDSPKTEFKNISDEIDSSCIKREELERVTIEDAYEGKEEEAKIEPVTDNNELSEGLNKFVVENIVKLLNGEHTSLDGLATKEPENDLEREDSNTHEPSVLSTQKFGEKENGAENDHEFADGEDNLLEYLDLINDEHNTRDKSNLNANPEGDTSKNSKSPTPNEAPETDLSPEHASASPFKNATFLNELDAVLERYNQQYGIELVTEKTVDVSKSVLPITEEIFTKHTTLEMVEEDDVIFNELDAVLENYNQHGGMIGEVSMDVATEEAVTNQAVLSIREEVYTKHSIETTFVTDDVIFSELDAVLEKYDIIENDLVQKVEMESIEAIDISVEIQINKNGSRAVVDTEMINNNSGEIDVAEKSSISMEKYKCLLHNAESSIKKIVAMSTEETNETHDHSSCTEEEETSASEGGGISEEECDMSTLNTNRKYNELLRKVSIPCLDTIRDMISSNEDISFDELRRKEEDEINNTSPGEDSVSNCIQSGETDSSNGGAQNTAEVCFSDSRTITSSENNPSTESEDEFGKSFEGRAQEDGERISWGDSMELSQDDDYEDYLSKKETNYCTILLVCIDSNQKFLNRRKLWTLDETTYKSCETIHDVRQVVNDDKFPDLKYIFIHTGTTDIERKSGRHVHDEFLDVISFIRQEYPTVKIILSQITPRTDERDNEVRACNCLIETNMSQLDYITVVNHDYLRNANGSYYYDEKHIHKNAIWRFAANIKRGLREAYGITFDGHKRKRDNTREREPRDRKMVGKRKLYRYNSASDVEKVSRQTVCSDKQRSQSLVLFSQREPK